MNLRIGYDGDVYYIIALNSFVHVVMYAYYQCTTLNIPVPTAIKKLVTNMQMIQFVTMITQGIWTVAFKCAYPQPATWIYLAYVLSLLVLFQNFSIQTYSKTKDTKAKKTN
jgi:elongation of very long chain fatty acids protein 4